MNRLLLHVLVAIYALSPAGCQKSTTVEQSTDAEASTTSTKSDIPSSNTLPYKPDQKPTAWEQSVAAEGPVTPAISTPAPAYQLAPAARGILAPSREIDERRTAAAGIRQLTGKHLTLFTDLPGSPAVDELPAVFDQMFDFWCQYFSLEAQDYERWKMRGFLIKDHARFDAAGLIPPMLPEFANGYTIGHEFWMNHQTSDYYQRHLLLHEGTHGFMLTVLGGTGDPWYAEGMAELLSTHRWQEGQLTPKVFPTSPREVPRLGRIEMVQHAYAAGETRSLDMIFAYPHGSHQQNETYGWCWAAAAFLDGHPHFQSRFRQLAKFVADKDFTGKTIALFQKDWQELNLQWQIFVAELDHGHDLTKAIVDLKPGRQLSLPLQYDVSATLGWQNTGLLLKAGEDYSIAASGRFQVDDRPKPWISEADGVSIRYVRGQPLGRLLAVVLPEAGDYQRSSSFSRPIPVGSSATIRPTMTGTLYLKINDNAGELSNNAGQLTVSIQRP